jgi:hypothetical protein
MFSPSSLNSIYLLLLFAVIYHDLQIVSSSPYPVPPPQVVFLPISPA